MKTLFFKSLIRKRQRQGFRSFENQGIRRLTDDCFQNESNAVFGVSCKDYLINKTEGGIACFSIPCPFIKTSMASVPSFS